MDGTDRHCDQGQMYVRHSTPTEQLPARRAAHRAPPRAAAAAHSSQHSVANEHSDDAISAAAAAAAATLTLRHASERSHHHHHHHHHDTQSVPVSTARPPWSLCVWANYLHTRLSTRTLYYINYMAPTHSAHTTDAMFCSQPI